MKNKITTFFFVLIASWPGLVLGAAGSQSVPVPNPLQAESIPQLAGQIIRGLMGVTGALALFFLVWGGIVWMTSGGNSDRVKRGRETIVWAILGLVVIFLSYVVINFVFDVLDNYAA